MWSSSDRDARNGRNREGEGLGAVLDQLAIRRPWRSGMALGFLARRWQDVVGERLARESEPVGLEGGTLFVQASSAGWAAQLRFLTEEVRSRAEEVTGEGSVRAVRIVLRRGSDRPE